MPQARQRLPLLPWACATVMAVLGFLPLVEWIPGGHGAEWFGIVSSQWVAGSLIGLGVPLVAFIIARRTGLWRAGLAHRLGAAAAAHPVRTALIAALIGFTGYTAIALTIFSGRPLHIDEIAQVIQARIFAEGQITRPAAPYPGFFSAQHVVEANGRVFGQFPIGGPLMLLPGVLLGAPWLTGPLFAAGSIVLFWLLMRAVEPRPSTALGAAVVFAAAPFTAFMAGSHMNHVAALTWLLAAMWCLQRVTGSELRAPAAAVCCGFALGMAASIRPVEGAAFALPAAVWLLVRGVRRPALLGDVVAAGAGVAVPAAAMLAFNALTTGDPLLFGYELLWGSGHRLGFHEAPWGVAHTPVRGLEIVNLMFLRLQTYLFESPVPSLLPVIAALLLAPAVRGFDRYLLWSSALLVGGYFAYWHDGFFLGPRFAYALMPALALWTARLPHLVRDRFPRLEGADRFVVLAYATSVIVALMATVPIRAGQYSSGLTAMRLDYMAPAGQRGVRDALILVRESWGSQVMVRMWALGVPRSAAESLYRRVDTCLLERAVSSLERTGLTGEAALGALTPLLRDSARVVVTDRSPDTSERMLPGLPYGAVCQKRIAEDLAGYTFLPPILARDPGGNVYARDLHARDTLLLQLYPDREVFILRASSSHVGAPLELYPFAADSARMDWAMPSSEAVEPWR
ncbi:MAG TPA: hypothetical protein VLE53_08265 [Gemmatimonadaceae bacterium]|nr:hypothetical protein [Gemmatimonadaceae bacterium]